MRTTITLDEDLYRALRQRAKQTNRPFKQLLNEALRAGMSPPPGTGKPYKAIVFKTRLRPGIDPTRFNQLVDDMEIQEFIERHAGRR